MKNFIAILFVMWLTFSFGCSVAGGIFKAGVWLGIVAAIAVVGVIIYFISKAGSKS